MLQIHCLSFHYQPFQEWSIFPTYALPRSNNMLSIFATSLNFLTKEFLIIWTRDPFLYFIVLNIFVIWGLRFFQPFWKISSPLAAGIIYSIVFLSPWLPHSQISTLSFSFLVRLSTKDFRGIISFTSYNSIAHFQAQICTFLVQWHC